MKEVWIPKTFTYDHLQNLLMPKISILHPSYKRPKLGVETMTKWLTRAKDPHEIEYILCLSEKDDTVADYLINMGSTTAFNVLDVKVIYCPDANMVKQVNLAASVSSGNLLINVSDDFDCPENWDEKLLTALEGKEDYVVKTQDGIQRFIHTLPIMDRRFYQRFNYIYAPVFAHFYGDEALAEVGKKLGKTITLDLEFPHIHYIKGLAKMDEVNVKNNAYFEQDKKAYFELKKRNYDLK